VLMVVVVAEELVVEAVEIEPVPGVVAVGL
jgi:hypothetical protein